VWPHLISAFESLAFASHLPLKQRRISAEISAETRWAASLLWPPLASPFGSPREEMGDAFQRRDGISQRSLAETESRDAKAEMTCTEMRSGYAASLPETQRQRCDSLRVISHLFSGISSPSKGDARDPKAEMRWRWDPKAEIREEMHHISGDEIQREMRRDEIRFPHLCLRISAFGLCKPEMRDPLPSLWDLCRDRDLWQRQRAEMRCASLLCRDLISVHLISAFGGDLISVQRSLAEIS
jgi:hypothetical protein